MSDIPNLSLPGLYAAVGSEGTVLLYPSGDNYDCASLADRAEMIALRDWLNKVIEEQK